MGNENNAPGTYRIEISGWGLDEKFFVEQTDLYWSEDGSKRVALHRQLSDGALVFVRLLGHESGIKSIPVNYKVSGVEPMGYDGMCGMRLLRLHPRTRESITGVVASNLHEERQRGCDANENSQQPEVEEILQ